MKNKKIIINLLIILIAIAGFYLLSPYFLPESEGKTISENVPGVTDEEIVIGSSLALGGHASFLGTQTNHGAQSYINKINENGGIHGRTINLISYDDEYDPEKCVNNTNKLINEDNVFSLFSYVGTPTSVKVIPIIDEKDIPLVGLFTGANALRDPVNPNIFNIRASYYQEVGAVIKNLVEDLGVEKIAVFYQDDAYGLDGLTGAEIALNEYNLSPVSTGTYIRGTNDVEEALDTIIESQAEAVIMIGTYSPCAKFIKLAKEKEYNPLFHNVSFVGAAALAEELGEDGEGVVITQVVAPPIDTIPLPAIEEYTNLLNKYYPEDEPDFVGLEGFINAKILVEGLERAGKDLTRDNFKKALESIENYPVGIGSPINFSSDDHQGLEEVYFTQIRNQELKLFSSWKIIKW